MKKNIIFSILGASIILYSIFAALFSNLNFGIYACLSIGILFIAIGVNYKKIKIFCSKGIGILIKYIFIGGFIIFISTMVFLSIYGSFDTCDYKEDAIIVLGAGIRGETVSTLLKYRLDKAYEYCIKNKDAIIIVSGGKGPQEDISEAYAMKKYLLNKGVNENKIIMEDKSTSTYENFKFSKKILDDRFDTDYKVSFVTNKFHVFRSANISKKIGLNVSNIGANDGYISLPFTYVREFFAVLTFCLLNN